MYNRNIELFILATKRTWRKREINKELLIEGYDPIDIEDTWEVVLARSSFRTNRIALLIKIYLVLFGAYFIYLCFFQSYYDIAPDYPGSTAVDKSLMVGFPAVSSIPVICGDYANWDSYKAFITKDSKEKILSFYQTASETTIYESSKSFSPVFQDRPYLQESPLLNLCFVKKEGLFFFKLDHPPSTLLVVINSKDEPELARKLLSTPLGDNTLIILVKFNIRVIPPRG
ncbi:MAG TPA: hypothetical protein VH186_29740 [Chloroflexia bacterium]|nr:hypothetical protein [Chloroflexia bacterium]